MHYIEGRKTVKSLQKQTDMQLQIVRYRKPQIKGAILGTLHYLENPCWKLT